MTSEIKTIHKHQGIGQPPVSVLSAFVTIVLDMVWFSGTLAAASLVVTIILVPLIILACFFTCFIAVFSVQKFIEKDSLGVAFAKGLVMGIAAAVPLPVCGTGAGAVLLGWAGLYKLTNRHTQELPAEVIDVDALPVGDQESEHESIEVTRWDGTGTQSRAETQRRRG